MATSAEPQKKQDIRERFNKFLDDILSTGPRFELKQIQEYARAAEQARRMRETTPVIREPEASRMVPRRGEMEIPPQMTRQAIEAALNLGERLELAATAAQLDLSGWIRHGR